MRRLTHRASRFVRACSPFEASDRRLQGYRGGVQAHDDSTLGSAGESATLGRIIPRLPTAARQLLGPGDDAAVLATPDGRTVVSTDVLVHGPDFRIAWSSPHDLGWKAAATNLADIAAMGAAPTALLVALAAPPATPVTDIEALADGLRDACAALAPGVGVIGGDLSASPTLTVAVTVFGDLDGRAPVLRSGARPGDVVALAGTLGRAAAGLALLFSRAVDDDGEPDAARLPQLAADRASLVAAQLAPRPPLGSGLAAARGGATSMIDVSDGLLLDGGRIAAASGVALDLSSGPLSARAALLAAEAPELAGLARSLVLSGGEDHALLATFPPGELPGGFEAIGRVVAGSGVTVEGHAPGLAVAGWDPFEEWDGATG